MTLEGGGKEDRSRETRDDSKHEACINPLTRMGDYVIRRRPPEYNWAKCPVTSRLNKVIRFTVEM